MPSSSPSTRPTPPDVVSVILNAHGFNDLLEQLNFLGRAKHQQQSIISVTQAAKEAADAAVKRLTEPAAPGAPDHRADAGPCAGAGRNEQPAVLA